MYRRDLLAGSSACVFGIVSGCLDSSGPTGGSGEESGWNQYGANARNTGYSSWASGPDEAVTTRWTFEADVRIMGGPIFANDLMYVASRDHHVYALDPDSGTIAWSFETDDEIYATPAVVGEELYVASIDDTLYALDAVSGDEIWTYGLGYDVEYHQPESPTATADLVVVGGRELHVVDTSSGDRLVRREGGTYTTPALLGETAIVGRSDGEVVAIDSGNGDTRWRRELDRSPAGIPTVSDDTVYVTGGEGDEGARLYALDATSGRQRWQVDFGDRQASNPTVTSEEVIVATEHVFGGGPEASAKRTNAQASDSEDEYGGLFAFDPERGEELWRTTDRYFTDFSRDPVAADGIVYVNFRNDIHAFSRASGEHLWEGPRDVTTTVGTIIPADGRLYATHPVAEVSAFD